MLSLTIPETFNKLKVISGEKMSLEESKLKKKINVVVYLNNRKLSQMHRISDRVHKLSNLYITFTFEIISPHILFTIEVSLCNTHQDIKEKT